MRIGNILQFAAMRKPVRQVFVISWFTLGLTLGLTLFLLPVVAAEGKVAVIYPQLREPYNKIFERIIGGIVEELHDKAVPYSVDPKTNGQAPGLEDWLKENNVDAVIGLGRQGYEIASSLQEPPIKVAGALITKPDELANGLPIISMTPDPAIVLQHLKLLAPAIKSISFAYSEKNSGWYVQQIRRQARAMNLKVRATPVENVRQAAIFYKAYFDNPDPEDALWLLQDPAAIDNGPLLSTIMQKAWEHDVVVFSNNPAHVARGALFSHYPASEELGRSLARLAMLEMQQPGSKAGLLPMQNLRLAVNMRTAEHLGYVYTGEQRAKIDLTFPVSR